MLIQITFFNDRFYRQLDGSPMDNPASAVLANLIMNHVIEGVKQNYSLAYRL